MAKKHIKYCPKCKCYRKMNVVDKLSDHAAIVRCPFCGFKTKWVVGGG